MTVGILRRVLSFRLVPLLLLGIMILYLGASFLRQATVSHQRSEELRDLDQQLAAARQRTARLEERLNYVYSPEAAEEWARENGWAKQDEVTVVVVAPEALPASHPRHIQEGEGSTVSNREAWWDLFFGER